jgi:hypothetical protein
MDNRTEAHAKIRSESTRRQWLAGITFLGLGALGADDAPPKPAVEPDAAEDLRRSVEATGLKNVRSTVTEHYVAVGDTPEAFLKEALKICESLGTTFLDHFNARGFEVKFTTERMAVVALAGPKSYKVYQGKPVSDDEVAHYDVSANRLVVFDFRKATGKKKAVNSLRTNTFVLVHEALHQLTYTTGLLSREGDVPLAVSEGFATYGEMSPSVRPVIGRVNRPRVEELKKHGGDWIPVEQLLTRDALFEDPKTNQLAYAESWLLVYDLLRNESGRKKLREYLAALRPRRDPGKRVEDAESTLGSLDKLDIELKKRASLL